MQACGQKACCSQGGTPPEGASRQHSSIVATIGGILPGLRDGLVNLPQARAVQVSTLPQAAGKNAGLFTDFALLDFVSSSTSPVSGLHAGQLPSTMPNLAIVAIKHLPVS